MLFKSRLAILNEENYLRIEVTKKTCLQDVSVCLLHVLSFCQWFWISGCPKVGCIF